MSDMILKKDWDRTVCIDSFFDDKNYFSSNFIETQEYIKIKDFVINKNSGSLLVSGERGSGKTTSVIRALKKSSTTIFPVYINALYLESIDELKDGSFLATLSLLKQVIRAFDWTLEKIGATRSKKLKELLEFIYFTDITISKTGSSKIGVGINSELGLSTSQRLFNGTLNINPAGGLSFINEKNFKKAGYSIDDYTESLKQCLKDYEKKGFCVKKTLKLLNKIEIKIPFLKNRVNKKIIFVVDELDFYDENNKAGQVRPKEVLQSIKRLKNLFNSSEAQFIFIVGKKTYEESLTPGCEFTTLFSDRIFLTKPSGESLIKCLDNYFITKDEGEKLEIFKWFLVQNSRHNFYKLIQEVKAKLVTNKTLTGLIVNNSVTTTEKSLTVIHYALNSIYRYYINTGIFQHYSEALFNELSSIEENFDNWIHGQGLNSMSLDINTNETNELKPEIRGQIQTAKRGFISYIFKLNDNEIPPDIENSDIKITTIPWDTLRSGLTFTAVKKGIVGAVTPKEIDFIKLSNEVSSKIRKLLFVTNENELENLFKLLRDNFPIDIPEIDVSLIKKVLNSIDTQPFFRRELKEVENVYETLKRLSDTIDNRLQIYTKKIILQKELGNVSIENNEIIMNDKARCLILPKDVDISNNFEITAKVKLMPDSLLNFVFYKKYINSPTEDEFYMLRLDARSATQTIGEGGLHKPRASETWQYVDGIEKRISSHTGVWTNVKLLLKDNQIIFTKKIGMKGNYRKIVTLSSISENITYFGLFSEKGQIEVKDVIFH